MMGRILLENDEWLVSAGLLGGITVRLKPRGISIKASSAERRHLMDTLDLLKARGSNLDPTNRSLQDLLQAFAEAVVGRGDARWQAYFEYQSPEEVATTYAAPASE